MPSPTQKRRPSSERPWAVRRSPRHGRGVYATARIPAGTRIIEYTGELISEAEGERRYPTLPSGEEEPEHTYLLTLDEQRVIDANVGGNAARFINHSCEPNCEPIAYGDHMWIVAIRDIRPGEELAYDYAIELDEPHTPARKRRFPCRCGARRCRGSILKPKYQPLHPLVRAAIRRYGPSARDARA
ncbi:MAG: SET domain-containing protein-lysine N-methyltransferase [Gemmatimonadaceae bacterium]|nr:SET domain-containing protein-lysine N-methyltransferase [Gemmatimonadaceae bacterium]